MAQAANEWIDVTQASANEMARVRYVREYPHFEVAAGELKERLNGLVSSLGVAGPHIKVRAKDVSSFVKKLRKYGDDCWERTTDKVGAQIVVRTLQDVRQLRAHLERGVPGLTYLYTTDKSIYNGDPRELRYTGVHIQVALSNTRTTDGEVIEGEIQLRTQAQDVWASMEHGLIYKPVISPSVQVARKVARLSVLVEMFDEEVDAVIAQLARDPRYETALLLHQAERWFLTFVTESGEAELSLEVLAQIRDAFEGEDVTTYQDKLEGFVSAHRERITEALRDYGALSPFGHEFDYFLFSQPECLILWERIESRPLALARTLAGTEFASAVAALADVWGAPLFSA